MVWYFDQTLCQEIIFPLWAFYGGANGRFRKLSVFLKPFCQPLVLLLWNFWAEKQEKEEKLDSLERVIKYCTDYIKYRR